MKILQTLTEIWEGANYPFLVCEDSQLRFSDIIDNYSLDLSEIRQGDVVAIIGDFNPSSIKSLIRLIDKGAIVVPLTQETKIHHDYFFETALVDIIIEGKKLKRRKHGQRHEFIENLRSLEHSGLILFSSGTTGRPKAILHDFSIFLKRFETRRPAYRTINFLLFDHIGGINTLFHTLFNQGIVVAPVARTVDSVLDICRKYEIEVLPTTPTFLRMMLISGAVPSQVPKSLKVITYGTEIMDQSTLYDLCKLLPNVDFRQTYGMSELGIFRVKSEARDSLYMKAGGEGIKIREVDGVLHIHSNSRMVGYLNAPSPFDSEGWFDTKDIVEFRNDYFKIIGRVSDTINVGGLKFLASEIESVAITFPNISLVKAFAKQNPITGQHVELVVQPINSELFDKKALVQYLKERLQPHMVPKRVHIDVVEVGHRYKRS